MHHRREGEVEVTTTERSLAAILVAEEASEEGEEGQGGEVIVEVQLVEGLKEVEVVQTFRFSGQYL
jgi:hypothetical protein